MTWLWMAWLNTKILTKKWYRESRKMKYRIPQQYFFRINKEENFIFLLFLFINALSTNPEKAMAPHSSTLPWKIPWTEEPGGLQSMGSRRVRHDWATSLSLFTFMHCRRKWQPTPVFLPGEPQGWGRTGSDTTEVT